MGTYYPPTVDEAWSDRPPERYFKRPVGISVIKRSGAWVAVRGLDQYEIMDLVEGVDYFVGGCHYNDVADSILDDIEASGLGTVGR